MLIVFNQTQVKPDLLKKSKFYFRMPFSNDKNLEMSCEFKEKLYHYN